MTVLRARKRMAAATRYTVCMARSVTPNPFRRLPNQSGRGISSVLGVDA